ncbi:MAG: (2Fe-2S)-binding protein [Candidatus Thiodiazotropha sp.]
MILTINGKVHEVSVPDDIPLLWVLRDYLKLTGTKYGCGVGACGSCMVLVDGDPQYSCILKASDCVDKDVVTIEGAEHNQNIKKVQQAWIKHQVPQCGYCQSGQILMAASLLDKTNSPNEEDIDRAMSRVLCRCGTYPRVKSALLNCDKNCE